MKKQLETHSNRGNISKQPSLVPMILFRFFVILSLSGISCSVAIVFLWLPLRPSSDPLGSMNAASPLDAFSSLPHFRKISSHFFPAIIVLFFVVSKSILIAFDSYLWVCNWLQPCVALVSKEEEEEEKEEEEEEVMDDGGNRLP